MRVTALARLSRPADRLHQAIESLRATPTSDKVGGAASDLPQRLSGLAAEVDALREAQGRQAEALASLRGAVEAVGERARRGEEAAEGVAELRGRVGRIKEVRGVRNARGVRTYKPYMPLLSHCHCPSSATAFLLRIPLPPLCLCLPRRCVLCGRRLP